MSAALKQKSPEPAPTPFPTPERAALAHAITALADADARRVALGKATATANAEVLKAIGLAEAAEAALAEAQGNTARHLVDKALGNAGAAPLTVREARAAVIEAQDHLDECRATRAALKTELDGGNNGWSAVRVADAARAVIRAEMQQRAVALAASVAEMQRQLVAAGSGLEWLHRAGVFRGEDDLIRKTVQRLEVAPQQWATGSIHYATSFAPPSGRLKLEAAFEALKRDATAALPKDLA